MSSRLNPQKILRRVRDWNRNRLRNYYGTSLFLPLKANPLPQVLLLGIVVLALFSLGKYIHFLSDFLFWFVKTLEITKILKIPFLDNETYYQYLALFTYVYLSLSILFDTAKLWASWTRELVIVGKEVWISEKLWWGRCLHILPLGDPSYQLSWSHSFLMDWLGINQISWSQNGKEVGRSPFFFPYGKNRKVIQRVLKRETF